ncbi:MAG: MarR family winged helix-turn-helix transcriptional regulator [Myxococcota bacterium]
MRDLNPWDSLGFHCNITFKAFVRCLDAHLEETGVSRAQFLALAHLVAAGPLSQTQLADRLFISPATTARLVDRMERDGWVERHPDPDDRRVKRVLLTDEARAVWSEVSGIAKEILARSYRGVDPADIETAKRVLAQLRENLGE